MFAGSSYTYESFANAVVVISFRPSCAGMFAGGRNSALKFVNSTSVAARSFSGMLVPASVWLLIQFRLAQSRPGMSTRTRFSPLTGNGPLALKSSRM